MTEYETREMAVAPYLSAETLATIDRPIEDATGLPNEAYTSEDYFRLERDQLFARTWTVVCVGSEIPNPGDIKPVHVCGIPLIAVRNRGRDVNVFHNVCSHRGQRLATEPCRVTASISCPYHSWTYDLDGKLIVTPRFGGETDEVEGFDKSLHGLKPARSGVWCDMVFVNLSGDAAPLEEHLKPLHERWADYDLGQLRYGNTGAKFTVELKANWKLAIENNLEAYHLPWVHPSLNSYSSIDSHFNIFGGHLFAGQASRSYDPQDVKGQRLSPFLNLPEKLARSANSPTMYPNVFLGMMPDHAWILVQEPLAPDYTLEHFHIYYLGEAASDPAYAETRETVCERWHGIMLEDVWAVEGLQIGRHSPAYTGGVFSPVHEPPTHHFHRWVAHMMANGDGAGI